MIRVVLADDAVLFRAALAELLRAAGCAVVAQVGGPAELLASVATDRPDLAVVDIRMPPTHRLEGLRAAVRMRREHPGVAVLVLSQYLEAAHLTELTGGFDKDTATGVGYLLKDRVSGPDFIDAVRRVAGGGCVFDPDVVDLMLGGPRRRDARLGGLTDREHEVLALMAQGRSNQAIAGALHLTGKTVETHVRNIFQRLVLPQETEHHRRVLAVLAYLQAS